MTSIDDNAFQIMRYLASVPRDQRPDASQIAEGTGLSPDDINDATSVLVDSGLAEWTQTFGTAPFDFHWAWITAAGRYELDRALELSGSSTRKSRTSVILPPAPVGSPYGFEEEDWEAVATRKAAAGVLHVVFGLQFESGYYETDIVKANVEEMFNRAVKVYSQRPEAIPMELVFKPLAAGYGGHLFNEIAGDIIGADIAVFETSDLNPNVMLEMGVALTWGIRVLPIKLEGRPKPPSDVSGQTWADYRDSAAAFIDPDHESKLVAMVQRALHKKAARLRPG
jgi:hypothetical protein